MKNTLNIGDTFYTVDEQQNSDGTISYVVRENEVYNILIDSYGVSYNITDTEGGYSSVCTDYEMAKTERDNKDRIYKTVPFRVQICGFSKVRRDELISRGIINADTKHITIEKYKSKEEYDKNEWVKRHGKVL